MVVIFAALLSTVAAAAPTLSVTGSCPGVVDIDIGGLTPGERYAFLYGAGAGSDPLPSGPCAGTLTDLAGLRWAFTRVSADGTASLSPSLPDAACGQSIQVLDNTTCTLSPAVMLGDPVECDPLAAVDPPGLCPDACTGGCEDATCIIDCTSVSACQTDSLICPDGLNCQVRCWGQSSCQLSTIRCPATEGTCDIQCDGLSACQVMELDGGAGGLDLSCSFTSTCQGSDVRCGDGPCKGTCSGLSSGVDSFDCGASCDCTTDCL